MISKQQTTIETLFQHIESGFPILTVNTRLARHIRMRYEEKMLASGQTMWATPVVIPFSSWLKNIWDESTPGRPLMSSTRSRVLWEKIVSDDPLMREGGILLPDGALRIAYRAYTLLHEYNLELPEEDFYLTEEAKALKRWSSAYEKAVEALDFIDPARLKGEVRKIIDKEGAPLPGSIILAGFDKITPATKQLLDTFHSKKIGIDFWPYHPVLETAESDLTRSAQKITIHRCDDMLTEVRVAAKWIREKYRSGLTIGIIVPELERYRPLIMREFRAELAPASVLPGQEMPSIFNVSLGAPLRDEPIVRSALDILSIGPGKIDIDVIQKILLSPYMMENSEEQMEMARLEIKLRESGRQHISLAGLTAMSGRDDPVTAGLSKRFSKWIDLLGKSKERQPPGIWADLFDELLRTLRWPTSNATLTSTEYQALQAFNSLLSGLASLDDLTGPIERQVALRHLAKMAGETIHQPQTPDAPIQVLGLLESSGLYFDELLLLGVHDEALPALPSPNPFIPFDLQQQKGLPHASFDRELKFAKTVTNRLIEMSTHLTITCPKIVEGKEVQLSPIFSSLKYGDMDLSGMEGHSLKEKGLHSASREPVNNSAIISLDPEEGETIRGGTSILKDQSACPFRAFALHRLKAKGLAVPEPGLSAQERGTLLHHTLKNFWETLKDSTQLKRIIEENRLDVMISTAIAETMETLKLAKPFSSKYLEIEKERLQTLLMEWVSVESKRPPFEVLHLEERKEVSLEGLKVRGDIDRIDISVDGSLIIIDYKTGKADPKDWETERPKEPQMMLYSLTDNYDGITFGRLKHGECNFTGISKDKALFEAKKVNAVEEWDDLMVEWKKTVERLAGDFVAGEADVDPRDFGSNDTACRFCDLTVLCRINDRE